MWWSKSALSSSSFPLQSYSTKIWLLSLPFHQTSPVILPDPKDGLKPYVLCWIKHCWLYCSFWSSCLLWLCVSTPLPITATIVILFLLDIFFIKILKGRLLLHVFLKYWYYVDVYISPLLISCKTLSWVITFPLTVLLNADLLTTFTLNTSGWTSLNLEYMCNWIFDIIHLNILHTFQSQHI